MVTDQMSKMYGNDLYRVAPGIMPIWYNNASVYYYLTIWQKVNFQFLLSCYAKWKYNDNNCLQVISHGSLISNCDGVRIKFCEHRLNRISPKMSFEKCRTFCCGLSLWWIFMKYIIQLINTKPCASLHWSNFILRETCWYVSFYWGLLWQQKS